MLRLQVGWVEVLIVDDYDTYTVYTDEEPPRYDYAIGVRGDSMLPHTRLAICSISLIRHVKVSGQLCVIAYNGQMTVVCNYTS
ncbi:S24 family peptidase [Streptococcus equi]|uniref:S24 family peptidase n=1 Tax=Streptococcus equi TaxID=1336 RepID=UPI001E5FA973|nr:S24 family peptidase [Streptococcus equi]MCD3373121.1 S24 family peptidase [Streptococcus equi subsp. zooepidemicus]